jgi:pyruvate/2-oxoglutarate dehydrogenase complex dihydrolipoamide dehydrogenase (E3) component
MKTDYDLVVIGGGAAGLVAAGMSAVLGAKTALIEHHRLGGDCTWTGCVPSKTLLHAARVTHQIRAAARIGIHATPEVDFPAVMSHVRTIRQQIYDDADAPPNFERLGIEVISARARFLDPHTLDLTGRRITARWIVIATGSRPRLPDSPAGVLTNETIFELNDLPRRLLVMGAGPIGIEMAQAFRRLGSAVTVSGSSREILPRDDPELAALLRESLEREGIQFQLGRKATPAPGDYDAILASIGRIPDIADLDLPLAGVEATSKGIRVDRHCRTTARHIYATGDVTGQFQFTHMAEHMSKVAVSNALLHWPRTIDTRHAVWCTYTDPEFAQLGAPASKDSTVFRFPFRRLDRAITEGETTGVVKVSADHRGRISGATILGPHAGELISEYALAMKNSLTLSDISNTIHPYPTYMLANRRAADAWDLRKLSPITLHALRFLFRLRGSTQSAARLEI